eukprot:2787663-Amphidinium_carterae.1
MLHDLLDKDDRQEATELSKTQSESAEVIRSLNERIRSINSKGKSTSKVAGGATSSTSAGKISDGTRRYPDKVDKPTDAVSQAFVEIG